MDPDRTGPYLGGGTQAEQDAAGQVSGSHGNQDQVAQSPGQTEQNRQREADQELLGQGGALGAAGSTETEPERSCTTL